MRHVVVVTGPSHSGKSTVVRALMRELSHPSAHVEIDRIVGMLELGVEEPWERALPVAYDVSLAETTVLLEQEFVVLFDSTFTYVPIDGRPPVLHAEQMRAVIDLARDHGAPVTFVRMRTALAELQRRRAATGRLSVEVIEETWRLHDTAQFGVAADVELVSDEIGPGQLDLYVSALARRIAERVSPGRDHAATT